MNQQNNREEISIVLISIVVIGCLATSTMMFFVVKQGLNVFLLSFMDAEPEVSPRQVVAMDGLDLSWQESLISRWVWIDDNSPNDDSIFMIIKDDKLIMPVWNIEDAFTANISLDSYDVGSGEITWQSILDIDSTFSIGKNSDTIFITATDSAETMKFCDPDFSCAAFKISAYAISSGEIIWEIYPEELFYNKSSYAVDINENRLYLVSNDIDPQPPITICIDTQTGNKAFDCKNSEFKDSTDSLNFWSFPEEFDYDSQNIVSNFAQNNDYGFFITANDQTLWVIDKESFEKVMSVEFEIPPMKKGNHYHIIANEEVVVGYMADNHQLIAFDLP